MFISISIQLNALPVHDDKYIETKIRTYSDKSYTKFRGLNELEDDTECECFFVISTNSLLVYKNKYYLQVYFDNYAYKIIEKQIIDYLDETDEN